MRNKTAVFMEIAQSLAKLGTCDRKQVGALIVRDGRCISWGYNGAPPGAPHCDQNQHGWADHAWALGATGPGVRDEWIDGRITEYGCRNTTHAEANALAFAARQGISTANATLYVTLAPCVVCARLLIAAGIERVVYLEAYRDTQGIELLAAVPMLVLQL